MRPERLPDAHRWLRVADPGWADPLDPTFAQAAGGRWNPPGSFPVLYLNEDLVTARINMEHFLAGKPYRPEDLRDDHAPVLIDAGLPRDQVVADIHTPEGVADVGLPASYPRDQRWGLVQHAVCQRIGQQVRAAGWRGVRCRSARTQYGAGRELAWFPAGPRSRARALRRRRFSEWFWV